MPPIFGEAPFGNFLGGLTPAITSQRKPQAVAGLVNCDVMAALGQPKNRSYSS